MWPATGPSLPWACGSSPEAKRPPGGFSRLARMRRLVPFLAFAFLVAGCGGAQTVSPTAETVVGTLPQATTQQAAAKGDAKAGEALFAAQGCGGCHKFQAAGTNGTVGPDLDKLTEYAQNANQGSLEDFIRESIAAPTESAQEAFW